MPTATPLDDQAPRTAARGPYRNGQRRRQQIVESAVQVFGQYGYVGGSLRRVADMVGVSPPALMRHFGTKEGLLAAVLEHSDQEKRDEHGGVHGLDFVRAFAGVISKNVDNRGMVELLLTVAAEASNPDYPARPFILQRYEEVTGRLSDELQWAAGAGEIRSLTPQEAHAEARGLVALMDGLQLQWLLDPSVDVAGIFDFHFQAWLDRWTVEGGSARAPKHNSSAAG